MSWSSPWQFHRRVSTRPHQADNEVGDAMHEWAAKGHRAEFNRWLAFMASATVFWFGVVELVDRSRGLTRYDAVVAGTRRETLQSDDRGWFRPVTVRWDDADGGTGSAWSVRGWTRDVRRGDEIAVVERTGSGRVLRVDGPTWSYDAWTIPTIVLLLLIPVAVAGLVRGSVGPVRNSKMPGWVAVGRVAWLGICLLVAWGLHVVIS